MIHLQHRQAAEKAKASSGALPLPEASLFLEFRRERFFALLRITGGGLFHSAVAFRSWCS
jgi:hypothetical protein